MDKRTPQVIANSDSSDDYDEDDDMGPPCVQDLESGDGNEGSSRFISSSPPPSPEAHSDDNALFKSDEEPEQEAEDQEGNTAQTSDEEGADQEMQESEPNTQVVQLTKRQNIKENRLNSWNPFAAKVESSVEKVLKACVSLLTAARSGSNDTDDPEETSKYEDILNQNPDINSWALRNEYGFYMNHRFHCYCDQRRYCKYSFATHDLLVNHLESVHNVSQEIKQDPQTQVVQTKKLAHWLITASLPVKIILDNQFNEFVQLVNNQNDHKYVMSKETLEKVIRAEHDIVFASLANRLKNVEYVSLVICQWSKKYGAKQIILVLSVSFIDEHWNKVSYTIAAEKVTEDEPTRNILQKIVIPLMDLGILDRVYSITLYEIDCFEKDDLFAYLQKISGKKRMSLTRERIYNRLLDQVIMKMRVELLAFLSTECEPLKKIISEISNCKCKVFRRESQLYSIHLMQAYFDNKRKHHINCAMRRYLISEADEECMLQTIRLDNELSYICDWLFDITNKNATSANKAYVICRELGSSIKNLAELKDSIRPPMPKTKTTTSKSYEVAEAVHKATYIRKILIQMYKYLDSYRNKLELGRAHVESFVYDSYAYNDSYFCGPRTVSLSKQKKNLHIIISDLENEDNQYPEGVRIIDLLGFNNEISHFYEDPDLATSSSSNILHGKRRRSNQSTIIPEPVPNQSIKDQVHSFCIRQSEYFKRHPDPNLASTDPSQSRISYILSDHTLNSQFDFWKQESDDQNLSLIAKHTRKTFAIHTTSHECQKPLVQFQKVYDKICESEVQDKDYDFLCKRALLAIWNKDFQLFKD